MQPTTVPEPPLPAGSLAESLRWSRFRDEVAVLLAAHPRVAGGERSVDLRALASAFWSWAAVLEHDAAFEALDPVDHAHFAAGQLLTRLLMHRPLWTPPLPRDVEARVLVDAVADRLDHWRRCRGMAPLPALAIDDDSPAWASFLENTATEPELAIAFLDEFTGIEPSWRYPQLVSERPAMRRARRADRGDVTPA